MSDDTNSAEDVTPDAGGPREAQAGEQQTDHGTDAPLNGGAHVDSGSFTGTNEEGVEYDGAFTDSEIPADHIKPGETEADRAGFEGSYTESEGVE